MLKSICGIHWLGSDLTDSAKDRGNYSHAPLPKHSVMPETRRDSTTEKKR
jgi:hypothetical protein